MQSARSLLFVLLFYPGTLLYALATMAASLIGTRPMRTVVHSWADFHHWLARLVLGIRPQVIGQLPEGPHLVAVKHQSMYETIEMLRLANTPTVVLKRELAGLPLFGAATRRYGVIPVDREAGARALRNMVAQARIAGAQNRPVVIFPEGTRVAPGEQPPLRAGFAGLYRALGLPVVPIAVDSGRIWGRGLPRRSGTVRFLIGEPLPPGLKRADVEAQIHAAINALEGSAP